MNTARAGEERVEISASIADAESKKEKTTAEEEEPAEGSEKIQEGK